MKKVSTRVKRTAILVIGSIISTGALFLSLTGVGCVIAQPESQTKLFLMGALFALAIDHLFGIVVHKKTKLSLYTDVSITALYAGLGIMSLFADTNAVLALIVALLFSLSIIGNRITKIIENKKVVSLVLNILIITVAGFAFAMFIMDFVNGNSSLLMFIGLFLMIAVVALKDILCYVFLRLKTSILRDIVRKTYAFEILLGLVLLILSFSLVFFMIEDQMNSYGDALWYSFCIVTTIGLGDITCGTVVGRVLSVVLGIYGIVVVALITSIIVNFYGEASKRHYQEEHAEQIEEKKEEKKTDEE